MATSHRIHHCNGHPTLVESNFRSLTFVVGDRIAILEAHGTSVRWFAKIVGPLTKQCVETIAGGDSLSVSTGIVMPVAIVASIPVVGSFAERVKDAFESRDIRGLICVHEEDRIFCKAACNNRESN